MGFHVWLNNPLIKGFSAEGGGTGSSRRLRRRGQADLTEATAVVVAIGGRLLLLLRLHQRRAVQARAQDGRAGLAGRHVGHAVHKCTHKQKTQMS